MKNNSSKLYPASKKNSSEIEKLKREISLVELVKSDGLSPKKQGKDYVMLCPFHDDSNASFSITPSKNLFRCFGCDKAGSVIDYIIARDGVDCRTAISTLINNYPHLAVENPHVSNDKTPEQPPAILDPENQKLLKRTIGYYHKTLKEHEKALNYLAKRGLQHPDLIDHFELGFSNRSLGLRLPEGGEGKVLREKLTDIGIYRTTGHEHFSGSLVIPIKDSEGRITEIYGRKINSRLRKGTPTHLYLPGKHLGIFNPQSLNSKEVILCESIIDALSFWVHDFRNVTASYGTQGFTAEHLQLFLQNNIEKVYIAYDNDNSGNKAAKKLADLLIENGIECLRVKFTKGSDANDLICSSKEPAKALQQVIDDALSIGEKPLIKKETAKEKIDPQPAQTQEQPQSKASSPQQPQQAQPQNQSPAPQLQLSSFDIENILIPIGDRIYQIRGFAKNLSRESMRINLKVTLHNKFHIDNLEILSSRQRHQFIHTASVELEIHKDIIKNDIFELLPKLEELQKQHIRKTLEPKKEKEITLTPEETKQATAFLESTNLINRILEDFSRYGLVGEQTNILITYLALTSRKLNDPLAIIIQSLSSAGKTTLMNTALSFIPEEDQVRYTSMTGQSLFYMGETNLKHKILAISEEEGAEKISYSLKIMQSEKTICIASTGKDPKTGKFVTHEYKVDGPLQIILTTTSIEVDEELQNRCIILTVDENRQQTKAIHQLQRERETLQGMLLQEDRSIITSLHQNAQRLIKPIMVVNPYATQLTFLDNRLRTRRDHMKYLTLIRAIALLHQFQRPIKQADHRGKKISYIEVVPKDIEIANNLMNSVLGTTLDELAPQTRRFLELLLQMVQEKCAEMEVDQNDFHFSRKQVREYTDWSDFQVRTHLQRLVDLEYAVIHSGNRGQRLMYELLYKGEGKKKETFFMGLIDTNKLTTT